MFTKKFERRIYIAIGVFLFSLALGGAFGAYVLWPSHREAGYQPAQPIAYSHRLHAGELQIPCLYCHTNATKGPQATIPALSVCMKCHTEVQSKDDQGNLKPGTATLLEHWNKQEPIVWNKVHDLADFVYFDHSRHMAAGDLTCQECHGPVETFEYMHRQYGMKMSWCLDCHRQEIPQDDPRRQRGLNTRGPIHCSACHR